MKVSTPCGLMEKSAASRPVMSQWTPMPSGSEDTSANTGELSFSTYLAVIGPCSCAEAVEACSRRVTRMAASAQRRDPIGGNRRILLA